MRVDEGGKYLPNDIQKELWKYWIEFWEVHVPQLTNNLPYGVIINGDSIDGVHHNATHQITHNLADQSKIAHEILEPIVEKCDGHFYMIRGTEAHVGISGAEEEKLASSLGAIPNRSGQYARNELWKKVGNKGLIHVMHHIGTTSSAAYESTAVHKELTEAYIEAARWNEQIPDMVIRSHRHRYFETVMATSTGRGRGVVTPAWQAKTPFSYKIAGARQSQPQFGGVVVIESPQGELYTRAQIWSVKRSKSE